MGNKNVSNNFYDKNISLYWEFICTTNTHPFFSIFLDERFGELKALAGRKYLDAACVYFWAATPVIITLATFGTYIFLGLLYHL